MNKKRDPKSVNKWSYNSPEFLEKVEQLLKKIRDHKNCPKDSTKILTDVVEVNTS